MNPLIAPPNHVKAEQTVLGSVLLSEGKIFAEVSVLSDRDFYQPAHAAIWQAMASLDAESRPIDCLTVSDRLRSLGSHERLTSSGGDRYLVDLTTDIVTVGNVGYYVRLVKAKADRRRWLLTAQEITSKALSDAEDEEFFEASERAVISLVRSATDEGPQHIRPVLKSLIAAIERRVDAKGGLIGISTGFGMLDHLTAGIQPSDLWVIAARPSMGKTAWALNLAGSVAAAKIPVLVFSLEMSSTSLVERLVSSDGEIDAMALRKGKLSQTDWLNLHRSMDNLSCVPIEIDSSSSPTIGDIRSRARRWRARHPDGNALVVVDYLQLIYGGESSKQSNREREIAEISRGLKALAKDLKCPVVALSQLNRSVESRSNKRPQLSDLRESGAIEQDADVIGFLYRDEVYDPNTKDKGIAELIISKHRCGPTGTVKLAWEDRFTRFRGVA